MFKKKLNYFIIRKFKNKLININVFLDFNCTFVFNNCEGTNSKYL